MRRGRLAAVMSGLLFGAGALPLATLQAGLPVPTFSLQAVRRNPACVSGSNAGAFCTKDSECDSQSCGGLIQPANDLVVVPGDVVVAEVFGSDWSPNAELLGNYEIAIDDAGFTSGRRGSIRPCRDPTPSSCVFIDSGRADFIFHGGTSVSQVDVEDLEFVASGAFKEFLYEPPPKYAATLVLTVSDDACGTFTILFRSVGTVMRDNLNVAITPLELQPLALTVSRFDPLFLLTDPLVCTIDARQPSRPDGAEPDGFDSLSILFVPGASPITVDDISISAVPPLAELPGITAVVELANLLNIELDSPIPPGHWTCLTYVPTAQRFCIGSLPGDVGGDRHSGFPDVAALTDCLLGDGSACRPHVCDLDRSGRCAPGDMLRLIDLLNGADSFDVWLNRTLPPCPTDLVGDPCLEPSP